MKYAISLIFGMFLLMSNTAYGVKTYISNPKPVGEARLEVLFWDIYDAKLIAPDGEFDRSKPFALSLTYLRDFEGENIASRSVDEMRKQGMKNEVKLAKWFEKMRQVFPNVNEGETLTGVVDANRHSHFYFNDEKLGTIEDEEFTQWFFDIWLSEQTSEPKMREQLLGLRN
uniref:chalcone isomerase family protein n=1 Tax=Ningiella ruwaisensis TaxID=2364274 RepID=UPI001F4FBE53|nr:chalcone isomerase family protein [Ningiella ruwaisensis]